MEKPKWRATALAVATAVLVGVGAPDAHALALGRITVQSALGEPLHAEIDIPEINAEELASLRTAVASPDAFRAAGLEYNPALSGIKITLERRPDGRHFLRLSSPRPINEPFVDLILETNWSSGRIVRDYTMLFDPPSLRQSAPPVAAQVTPAPRARQQAPAAAAPSSAAPTGRAPSERPAAPAPTGEAAATPPSDDGKQVTVKAGDTAGKIAGANKPANVSLDQMLVALLRTNPDAFIGGNVNRLKSGAVLDVPSAEEAGLVPPDEAKQTLVAQSRDFNEFRRRLAEGLPATTVGAPERQVTGKVQAEVEEKKAAPATPDKLTLSKGAVQGKAAEDKIARERAAQDAATRVAELNKNISDLNKLGVATAPATTGSASAAKPGVTVPLGFASGTKAAPAAGAASAPALVATAPASAPNAATPVGAAATPAASAAVAPPAVVPATTASAAISAAAEPDSAPSNHATSAVSPASAPAPAAPPVAAKAPAAPPAPVETTLVEDLMENPIVPASIGGVLALLLGFGFYRAQQRKKSTQVDSSFLESRLQPDSFFGASGGQRIDTNEGGATGSSLVYSPSQLDAAGDVDPVAEADVYLAYGRDLQAEEILKEAMRTSPQRVAIHSKLLEIYSKRRDAKAFELVATEAYGLARGEGPEWEHICELGQELDPSNSLYRPGGQPAAGAAAAAAAAAATVGNFGNTTATPVFPAAAAAPAATDLDLDLDFSIGDDEPAAPAPAPARAAAHTATQPTVSLNVPMLPASQPEPARLDAPDLTLDPNSLSFTAEPPKAAKASPAPAAAAAPAADGGMIEFDLGALSLDLGTPAAAAPAPAPAAARVAAGEPDTDEAPLTTQGAPLISADFDDASADPLATKLALAEEFNAIGDPDGARSLAQEVLAAASGDLKSRAQRFLAEIS